MNKIASPAALGSIMLSTIAVFAQTYDDPQIKAKATAIHASALTLDTHCDLPMLMHSRPDFDVAEEHNPRASGSRVDFPRIKKGGMDAMFFAVYLGQGARTPEGNAGAKKLALELFDIVHHIADDHPNIAGLATTPEEAMALKKAGKFSVFTAVENGWAIGNDLSLLKTYYDLGARYMTLCHTSNNDICDSSTDAKGPEHDGLSPFGVEVVKEMNRLGMIVDVSHTSDGTVWDCLELSAAPIVATHSSARALFNHPRNLTDDQIKAIAAKGGVIQMNMLSGYLKAGDPKRAKAMQALREKYPRGADLTEAQQQARAAEMQELNKQFPEQPATLQMVVDHIDHIVKLVGVDYVGIGPDLDGGGGVTGMYDVSEMGNITYELVKRGYSEEDIKKIWSGNFFRVMKEAQRVAAELNRG
ncbi:dipeptidase [Parapedobacter koreensis]|uniref:Membrane dipeptidase n=1 Tax=Parapedobacter koreensis TaxID=332977 RepID=A0A1H7G6S0_9SPHI|nr:dipeptidase [Parapedobacter koreensis]SEK31465.1 membrane dipeptidase [Parapedobacter koreensis]